MRGRCPPQPHSFFFHRPTTLTSAPRTSRIDTQSIELIPYTPDPPSLSGFCWKREPPDMAEAVGLAASIAGIITIASKISKLCDYYSEATNAREDMQQLVFEISSLASMLEPLSTPAEARKLSQTASDSMSQLADQCTEMLEQLQGELRHKLNKQTDSKAQNIRVSLKWPFKKEDTRVRIQKIERMKTAFILKLQLWVIHIFRS